MDNFHAVSNLTKSQGTSKCLVYITQCLTHKCMWRSSFLYLKFVGDLLANSRLEMWINELVVRSKGSTCFFFTFTLHTRMILLTKFACTSLLILRVRAQPSILCVFLIELLFWIFLSPLLCCKTSVIKKLLYL